MARDADADVVDPVGFEQLCRGRVEAVVSSAVGAVPQPVELGHRGYEGKLVALLRALDQQGEFFTPLAPVSPGGRMQP